MQSADLNQCTNTITTTATSILEPCHFGDNTIHISSKIINFTPSISRRNIVPIHSRHFIAVLNQTNNAPSWWTTGKLTQNPKHKVRHATQLSYQGPSRTSFIPSKNINGRAAAKNDDCAVIYDDSVSKKVKYENSSRYKEVVITRLRFGKCRLNYYLHQINKHQMVYVKYAKNRKQLSTLDITPTLQNVLTDPRLHTVILSSLSRNI